MLKQALLESICQKWKVDAATKHLVLWGATDTSPGDTNPNVQEARQAWQLYCHLTTQRPTEVLGLAYAAAYCNVRVALAFLIWHGAAWRQVRPDQRQPLAYRRQAIFVPLAERLGMWLHARALDDDAFSTLHRDQYEEIAKAQKENTPRWNKLMKKAAEHLRTALGEQFVGKYRLQFRPAPYHRSSLLRRVLQGRNLQECLGLLRFDVTVQDDDETGCLSLVRALEKRFYCVLAAETLRSSPNGYHAWHLRVHMEDTQLQLRITTEQQDTRNCHGVLARMPYPELFQRLVQRPHTISIPYLVGWAPMADKPPFFRLEKLKTSLVKLDKKEEPPVGIFTPAGELIILPARSTVLDGMGTLHEDLLWYYHHVTINDTEAIPERQLRLWDVLALHTGSTVIDHDTLDRWLAVPSLDATRRWLRKLVKRYMQDHRTHGRLFLRAALRRVAQRHGESHTERDLTVAECQVREIWAQKTGHLRTTEAPDLFQVISTNPHLEEQLAEQAWARLYDIVELPGRLYHDKSDYSFCSDCAPVLDAPITGTTTSSGALVVHAANCALLRRQPVRTLEWKRAIAYKSIAEFHIDVLERPGVLAQVADAVRQVGGSIREMQVAVSGTGATIDMLVAGQQPSALYRLYSQLEAMYDVIFSVDMAPVRPTTIPLFASGFAQPAQIARGRHFIGRDFEIAQGLKALQASNSWGVVIQGPRRIGKSSLLGALADKLPTILRPCRVLHGTWSSFLRPTLGEGLARLYRILASVDPAQASVKASLPQTTQDFQQALILLEASLQSYKTVVLAFDEVAPLFEWGTTGDHEAQTWWETLETCLATYPSLRLLWATLPWAGAATPPHIARVVHRCLPLSLGPLPEAAAYDLLARGCRISGISLDPRACQQLGRLTGRNPYFLQIVGIHLTADGGDKQLFRHMKTIDLLQVEELAAHFAGEATPDARQRHAGYCAHLWNPLPSKELRQAVWQVAHSVCGVEAAFRAPTALRERAMQAIPTSALRVPRPLLDSLVANNLLVWDDANRRSALSFTIPLFALWLSSIPQP